MSKRILVVDDAAFMRMMVKDILSRNGFEICGEAENGAIAVEKYFELKPDVVVMDITMPQMSGLEALKAIRTRDAAAKVVICSALGQQDMVVEAIQSGAKDFVVKPFQEDRLVKALGKLV